MPYFALIEQLSISPGGLPKRAVPSANVSTLGLEGDSHAHPDIHGGPRQAVLIVTAEGIEELIAAGYPLFPGALGENLTIRGIDRRLLGPGTHLEAGPVELTITKVRAPCNALNVYGPPLKAAVFGPEVKAGDRESPRWGLSGFYASVDKPGMLRAGDKIAIVGPRCLDEPTD
jgi:MOSC domain-containing protein YiiM